MIEIEAIRHNRMRITDHADEEAQADRLSFDEIFFSILSGDIIEDYPTDKPYPSCLIYGDSFAGERIHSVWAYNPETQWAVLVRDTDLIQTDGLIGVSGERNENVR